MANPYPRVVRDLADILIVEVKRVHQLAVDIDLELRGCTIADSHWSGSAISFPMVQDHLGNLVRSVDCIHHRSLHSRARLPRGVISNPTHKARSFLPKPDSQKNVNGERARTSASSVLHERQGREGSQAQIFRPERSTMGIDHILMVVSSVIESRAASKADADRTFDAPDSAIKMVVPGRIGRKAHRHEIHEFGDAVPVQESRDQNVGRRPVKLLVPDAFGERTNLESASLFVVQNRSENAGGVKIRETIPVNGAIYPHQRNGAHVADDSVIFDRLISHAIFSSDTASISSNL